MGRQSITGRWLFALAIAASLAAVGPAHAIETLRDGREVQSIDEFNAFAEFQGLPGAPFSRSPLGFLDALEAFFLSQQGSFEGFSRAAASAIDRVPVPSGSTSVSYRYDETLETFERFDAPLTPSLSQNARTNGKGVITIGFAFTELSYDEFDGQDRQSVLFSIFDGPTFDPSTGAPADFVNRFDFKLRQQVYATSISYGVLDNLDVGVLIPVIDSSFSAVATGRFFGVTPDGGYVPAVIGSSGALEVDPNLPVVFPELGEIDDVAFAGGFERSIFGLAFRDDTTGVGDVVVRSRYFIGTSGPVDFGTSLAITTPTGDEDDLLGLDAWRLDPRFLASISGEHLAGHVNLGYHVDTDDSDRDRLDYSVGTEGRVTPWLTVLVDHIGRLEVRGDTKIRTFEIAPGVKVNPWRDLVFGFNAIVPLNEEGLTADVTPNFLVEASMVF